MPSFDMNPVEYFKFQRYFLLEYTKRHVSDGIEAPKSYQLSRQIVEQKCKKVAGQFNSYCNFCKLYKDRFGLSLFGETSSNSNLVTAFTGINRRFDDIGLWSIDTLSSPVEAKIRLACISLYAGWSNQKLMSDTSTFRHTLCIATGYMSMLTFSVVYAPAIIENYRRKSVGALNISFPLLWLIGDCFSVTGAILNKLVFTVTMISIVYGLMDAILLSQYYFYRKPNRKDDLEDQEPLLQGESSASLTNEESNGDLDQLPSASTTTLLMLAGLTFLFSSNDDTQPFSQTRVQGPMHGEDPVIRMYAETCGYISTFLFMSARIPQIIQNYRQRSVEGLNLSMFYLALFGNTLYILSILAESTEWEYVVRNAPWIGGASGVMLLDCVIVLQWTYYTRVAK